MESTAGVLTSELAVAEPQPPILGVVRVLENHLHGRANVTIHTSRTFCIERGSS
jgi:hypothetical protein